MAQARDVVTTADAAGETAAEPGNRARDEWAHVRQQVLRAAFSQARQVFVVGDEDATKGLLTSFPGLFVVTEDERQILAAADTSEILLLSLEPTLLARGTALLRRLGCDRLFLLLPNAPIRRDPQPSSCSAVGDARSRLRKLGYVAVNFQRILWAEPGAALDEAVTSRMDRLNRETREVLVECRRRDDPATVDVLEERVATQRNQIDLLSDIQVQQARTRNAEKQRLARCSELEETVREIEKVQSAQARALLVAESEEIQKLRSELTQSRGEITAMCSTRVWRLGLTYWRIRGWLSGAFRGRER